MTKFIQVNKMYIDTNSNGTFVYCLSEQDILINTDHILQLKPRKIDDRTNNLFRNVSACEVIMSNGDEFYIHGSFDNIKERINENNHSR